jgi:hypothetical protein
MKMMKKKESAGHAVGNKEDAYANREEVDQARAYRRSFSTQ